MEPVTSRREIATFDHRDFPLELLLECKGAAPVSVCIPALDEAATVGDIVTTLHRDLVAGAPLVDEIIVVDDGSTDATAAIAAAAGAIVVDSPVDGGGHGKGEAMARGLACSAGELVVFLDGDIENFGSHFVIGLLGPLLVDRGISLVKGAYERPLGDNPTGGGRVTELVARPILSLLFPELAGVTQPLAGETAARRAVLDEVGLAGGYGVELALLLDVADLLGEAAVAQVDLGVRVHRNRPLAQLAPQARAVMQVALDRAGVRAR